MINDATPDVRKYTPVSGAVERCRASPCDMVTGTRCGSRREYSSSHSLARTVFPGRFEVSFLVICFCSGADLTNEDFPSLIFSPSGDDPFELPRQKSLIYMNSVQRVFRFLR